MIALPTIVRLAEETEFDPNVVSPGFTGFIMTGVLAFAIILLGVSLVRRLRRNAYRAEIREALEAELAEAEGTAADGGTASDSGTESEAPNEDQQG